MKFNNISIKWKLFSYLAVFVAFLLILLWFFQIVFLDRFYRMIKTQSIESSAQTIAINIDNQDLQALIYRIEEESDVLIRITDVAGIDLYDFRERPGQGTQRLLPFELAFYYNLTLENGGTRLQLINGRDLREHNYNYNKDHFIGKVPPPIDGIDGMVQSLIHTTIVERADGSQVMVMLSSLITPVNSTTETLRIQLLYVTLLLLLAAIILAFWMSRKISAPLIKINQAAKELAGGNYETVFDGKGYLEVAELNDTLNYAAKELSKVENLRRELIANISHDLRTPLTMISGYAEVMRDLPGENTPENVQIIIDESRRLTTLVNDILDISKLQSGVQQLNLTTFNLTQNVRQILTRYAKLTEQGGYHIDYQAADDVYVRADEVKLSQVIYNLINNAINYTGSDQTVVVRQTVRGDVVRLEMIDTGQGIPADQLSYIWERYYKVDKTHKRAAIGTGLGLSIVKGVLDLHQAHYGVESAEGKGSTFWFELGIVSSS